MLYLDIRDRIELQIREGLYCDGQKLPNERELCEEFGVSKSTVRETLRMLQRDGLIRSVNGVGSFVTRVLHSDLGRLVTTRSLLNDAGYEDKVTDCTISVVESHPEWEARFGCKGPFVVIERARTAGDRPSVWSLNAIPYSICGDAFSEGLSGSILDFLERKLGIWVAYALSEITVPKRDDGYDEAVLELLGAETMLLLQMHYDTDDRPIFFAADYMDNSRIKFFIRRNRSVERA